MSAYVCPLLKHCIIIWSPSLRRYIDSIEQVQRRFTKTLQVFRRYSYDQWSNLLNLKKLETRRLQQDLIWCYKILFGIVRVDPNAFFELCVTTTRGHPYKWYKHYNSCKARTCYFTDRIINVWNKLPVPAADFTTLSSCKRTTDYIDLTEL